MTNNTENAQNITKGEMFTKGQISVDCPFLALRVKETRTAKISDISTIINSLSILGLTVKNVETVTLTNNAQTAHFTLEGELRKDLKKSLNGLARTMLKIQAEMRIQSDKEKASKR